MGDYNEEEKYVFGEIAKADYNPGNELPFSIRIQEDEFSRPHFLYGETQKQLREEVKNYLERRIEETSKIISNLKNLDNSLEGRTLEEAEEYYRTLRVNLVKQN